MVRPGFKKTEVGEIPIDWDVALVSEIAGVKTGPFGSALHEKDYVAIGTPIITVEHLGERGITYQNLPMVSGADRERLKAYLLRENDIVFSRVGSVDRNALVTNEEDGWLFSGRLLRVRLQREDHYSRYLSYHFHSDAFKRRVLEVAVGQTMASINTQILNNINVIIPATKIEEKRIADALSSIDCLVKELESLISKKRDIKTATMQQLLTEKKRLPGFGEGKGTKQTELGEIPEDWDVVKIDDVLSDISMGPFGSDIKVSNFVSEGVPVLSGDNIRTYKLQDGFKNFVTVGKAKTLKKAVASRGDIVVTHRGTIGQIAYIPEQSKYKNYVISQSQFRARFKKEISPIWVVLYFLSHKGSSALLEGKGHTGVPAIAQATTTFRKLLVPLPSVSEQKAIVEVLEDLDASIDATTSRLEKTKAIKQGMMQELLTGRTRLI